MRDISSTEEEVVFSKINIKIEHFVSIKPKPKFFSRRRKQMYRSKCDVICQPPDHGQHDPGRLPTSDNRGGKNSGCHRGSGRPDRRTCSYGYTSSAHRCSHYSPNCCTTKTDTIVLALQQEPDTLHPRIGSMMARTIVMGAVILSCMAQNENADWVALGCEEVPSIDNGGAVFVGEGTDKHLEVSYKIRDGWRWTDGTPVTTKDVIYNWQLVMNPEMEVATRNTTQKIYDIVAHDDQNWTVVFMSENQARLAAAGELEGNVPFADFVDDYVQSGFAEQEGPVVDPVYWYIGVDWLPSHVLASIPARDQASSEFAKKPLGDGPYVVKEWKQGQEIVLEKSDLPFPLGEPEINTVIFRFFGETALGDRGCSER
jgi:ABC-type transport system substrate-binding protein